MYLWTLVICWCVFFHILTSLWGRHLWRLDSGPAINRCRYDTIYFLHFFSLIPLDEFASYYLLHSSNFSLPTLSSVSVTVWPCVMLSCLSCLSCLSLSLSLSLFLSCSAFLFITLTTLILLSQKRFLRFQPNFVFIPLCCFPLSLSTSCFFEICFSSFAALVHPFLRVYFLFYYFIFYSLFFFLYIFSLSFIFYLFVYLFFFLFILLYFISSFILSTR